MSLPQETTPGSKADWQITIGLSKCPQAAPVRSSALGVRQHLTPNTAKPRPVQRDTSAYCSSLVCDALPQSSPCACLSTKRCTHYLLTNLTLNDSSSQGAIMSSFQRGHGEGNGTPLQYSCLENPMDGGAWWAAVHGVAKSRTQLSDFTFTFTHWRRKRQPTPVFLPGESQGRGSLVDCRLWGRTESDTTEAT